MKVLHIITAFDDGGAQAVLYRFVKADKKNDHHVISLMDIGSYGDRLIKLDLPVYSLDMPGAKLTIGDWKVRGAEMAGIGMTAALVSFAIGFAFTKAVGAQ